VQWCEPEAIETLEIQLFCLKQAFYCDQLRTASTVKLFARSSQYGRCGEYGYRFAIQCFHPAECASGQLAGAALGLAKSINSNCKKKQQRYKFHS